jgi:hypothetical protein
MARGIAKIGGILWVIHKIGRVLSDGSGAHLPPSARRIDSLLMLGPDDIAEIEGEAEAFRVAYGGSDCPVELCEMATGAPPIFERRDTEGHYDGDLVRLRVGLGRRRARGVLGHELGHVWFARTHRVGVDIEERCDAFSAALLMGRDDVRRAIREVGHSYMRLAERFDVTQSTALLRIGEVTGRPVCLLRWEGPIFRGADFAWPSLATLVRALRERRSEIHPVKITDEPDRIGLMATRFAWREMVA